MSSGKTKDPTPKTGNDSAIDALLDADPVFLGDMRTKTRAAFAETYEVLMRIIRGEVKDQVVFGKTGEILSVAISSETKIRAAKVLKEMTLDKMISDRRDSGKDRDRGKGQTLEDALIEIERRKSEDRERIAAEASKPDAIRIIDTKKVSKAGR